VDVNTGTVRRGGYPVVGFGDANPVDVATVYGPATIAITALRADPDYCRTVAQSGTVTSQAVQNFKNAWNALPGAKPLPSGPSYEPATADAIHQVLGGIASVPGCTPTAPVSNPTDPALAVGAVAVSALTCGGLGALLGLLAKRPMTGAIIGATAGGAYAGYGVYRLSK
jgi:hypothetical protein